LFFSASCHSDFVAFGKLGCREIYSSKFGGCKTKYMIIYIYTVND